MSMRLLFISLAAACTLTAAEPLNVGAPGDVGPIGTIGNHPARSPSAHFFSRLFAFFQTLVFASCCGPLSLCAHFRVLCLQ